MGDSGFQIVQKIDGQFEIVKLAPVKKTTKTKLKYYNKTADNILRIEQPLPKDDSLNAIKKLERKGISTLKTYTRVPKKDSTPTLFQMKKDKDETFDASVTIKSEPELNIVDEYQELTEEDTLMEGKVVEERLLPTRHNVTNNKSITIGIVIEENVVEEKLLPTGLSVINNKSLGIIQKTPESNNCLDASIKPISSRPLLLQLAKQNVKCNICGIVFPKSGNQVETLRHHFFSHKTSVMRADRKWNRKGRPIDKMSHSDNIKKPPVILNSMLRDKQPKRFIPEVTTISCERVQIESSPKQNKFLVPANLPGILRRRKLVNIKPMSHSLLQKLCSNNSKESRGQAHVVIGNTLIKPIKQTSSAEVKEPHEAVSDDDDVEIVEQKPELIVIDDNDEQDETK